MRWLTHKLVWFFFALHRRNWGEDYVQGWYCTGIRHGPKYRYRRPILEAGCWLLTGHELSQTEWGYGGGEFVDAHCRWCDKVMRVPYEEACFRFPEFREMRRMFPR